MTFSKNFFWVIIIWKIINFLVLLPLCDPNYRSNVHVLHSGIQRLTVWFSSSVQRFYPDKHSAWIPSNDYTGAAIPAVMWLPRKNKFIGIWFTQQKLCLIQDFPKLPVETGAAWYVLFSFSDLSYFWPMQELGCWARQTLCLTLDSCFHSDQDLGFATYSVLILRLKTQSNLTVKLSCI